MNPVQLQKEFFDEKAHQWDAQIEETTFHRLKDIFENDLPEIHGPVLDIGSGTGILIPFLRKKIKHNCRIFETDISSKMLRETKGKINGTNNISLVQADVHTLPYINVYFQSVICFAVFPHLHDKNKVLKEIYRCLSPGGHLIILHLMGHKELNAMHGNCDGIVKHDHMPPVEILAEEVAKYNYKIVKTEESSNKYLIVARK
ncbi:MAG: hypothetical protein A2V66_14655 [Ignavibacteria bacterium RBG_13_36_8]|nr:MAG: hypothetical protein A2V66_14655 [Ignavibacteria bacterium RBG_13_36_8]